MGGEPTADRPTVEQKTHSSRTAQAISSDHTASRDLAPHLKKRPDAHHSLKTLAESGAQKLKGVGERIGARLEKRRLLRESEELGISKDMITKILDGYYDARPWILNRLGIKPPRLEFDKLDIYSLFEKGAYGGVLPEGKTILLSPNALRDLQDRFAQTGNRVANPPVTGHAPEQVSQHSTPLTLYQIGQEFSVEEITHSGQFRGARDRVTKQKLSPVEDTLSPQKVGPSIYNMQTHEVEAWKYKWLFYEDLVRHGKVTQNPLTNYVASLGVDLTQLR